MHRLDTIFESCFDAFGNLLVGRAFHRKIAEGLCDLGWEGEVVEFGGLWSAALFVVLHDHGVHEGVELVEIRHHFLVLRSDLFLAIGAESRRGERSGLVWRRGEGSH